jgi:hypothetical protein
MCYSQCYSGRPLSVVLTEPFDPFEPQPSSFFDDIPYIESDFATLRHHHHHHHHHHRSRSSGRRHKRETFSVYYPNNNYNSYCFSPPVPVRRPTRVTSREVLIEKIETVTVEEQQRRPPPPPPPPSSYMVSFVRAPSPPVRQLKIRPRPSSCFDLHRESKDIHQQQRENRWSKVVDEHHEEYYQYNYNYNFKTPERIVPIERESPPPPPPPPRAILYDATTSTEDLYIPPPPPPKPVRPATREAGTTTAGLPKRPLCVTETQIIERFEKTEKVRCDSASSTEGAGTLTKPCNSLNLYTAADRKREKNRTIVRPTSYPREVLVDTSGIFGFPGEFSEPTSPQAVESGCKTQSRSPFYPPDLL